MSVFEETEKIADGKQKELNIFRQGDTPDSFIEDAEKAAKVPIEDVKYIWDNSLDWTLYLPARSKEIDKEISEWVQKSGVRYNDAVSLTKFYSFLIQQFVKLDLNETQLKDDLQKVGIQDDHIGILLENLNDRSKRYNDLVVTHSSFRIPYFLNINWRIDLRINDNKYKIVKPTAIINIQYGTGSEREITNNCTFEINMEELLYLIQSLQTLYDEGNQVVELEDKFKEILEES